MAIRAPDGANKQMTKIGSKKSVPRCPLNGGRGGGSKAHMETTHFKKGLPFFIRINGKASHKRHVHIQNTFGGVILTLDTC